MPWLWGFRLDLKDRVGSAVPEQARALGTRQSGLRTGVECLMKRKRWFGARKD